MDTATLLFLLSAPLLFTSVYAFLDDHPRTVSGWLAPHTTFAFYFTLFANLLHGVKNAMLISVGLMIPFAWTRALGPLYGWRYPFGLLQPRTYEEWIQLGRNDFDNDANTPAN